MSRPSRPRLSTPQRREIILRSAHAVFTEKGFNGTTTKELSKAAGISEALLFRHYPTKAALYSAVQESCCEREDHGSIERLLSLEPSTSSLVFLLYYFFCRMALSRRSGKEGAGGSMPKLILQSLATDGGFARHCHERGAAKIIEKMEACLKASVAAGDVVEMPVKSHLRCWFSQHLAGMLAFNSLHDPPIVNYGVSRRDLAEQAVWYALRGVGLKDEAIRRYYHPEALSSLAGGMTFAKETRPGLP